MNPVFAVLGLSIAEVMLIVLVMMIVLLALIAAVVFLVVHFSQRKSAAAAPVITPSPAQSRRCPQCGATLGAAAPEGLCPACLLQHGIATDAPPVGQPAFTPPPFAELAKLFP